MKNHHHKNRIQVNFCNVNLLKFPNRKNKKKENKSPSFFTYSNISNEKETKTETTIFDEKDKTIQKLNLRIGELENRIKNLETIIITNTQTITINKNYETNSKIKKLINEPSLSIKKKIFFSQKQSPKKVISKFPKNKTYDDKRLLRNSHDLIKSLKSFTRNKLGRNINLSKIISRTNSRENIIHNYSYKNKENSYFRSFTKTNHKNHFFNKSVNNSSNFIKINDLIPKIPNKNLLNEQKIIKTRNFQNELINIKNRTKDLLESFSRKKFK